MEKRSRGRHAIALFLALAVTAPLALGSCDGSDGPSGPGPDPGPAPPPPPPPGPSFDFSGDLILFRRQIGQRQDLYLVKADGSESINLTDTPFADSDGAWSPDGSKIAFVSTRSGKSEVYTMNVDGTNVIRITSDPCEARWPEWSSDASKIYFSSLRAASRHIYEVDAEGPNSANETQLTDEGTLNDAPAGALDGKIFFHSTLSGCRDIWSMNPDGSDRVNVTDLCPSAEQFPAAVHQLTFTSDRDGEFDIFVSELDGSNPTNLTSHPARDFGSSWRGDGARLVFSSERDGDGFQLYAMNPDGTDVVRLTNSSSDDLIPEWRPSTGSGSIIGPLASTAGSRTTSVVSPAGNSATVPEAVFVGEVPLDAPTEADALLGLASSGGTCD